MDPNAEIIFGATFDASLDNRLKVSIVATGIGRAVEQPLLIEDVAARRLTHVS